MGSILLGGRVVSHARGLHYAAGEKPSKHGPTWPWPELLFLIWRSLLVHPSGLKWAGSWHTERTSEMDVQLILTWKKTQHHTSLKGQEPRSKGPCLAAFLVSFVLSEGCGCLSDVSRYPDVYFQTTVLDSSNSVRLWEDWTLVRKLDSFLSPLLAFLLSSFLPPLLLPILPSSVFSFLLFASLFPTSVSLSWSKHSGHIGIDPCWGLS